MRPLHGSTRSDSGGHSRHAQAAGWVGGQIVGLAVLLQFIVLGGSSVLAVAAGLGAALLSVELWTRRERWPHAASLVATTALGGAAMLAGGLLGGGAVDASHAHHGAGHGGMAAGGVAPLLLSPATAAMLVACAAGLHWSGCARSGGGWRLGVLHALCAAAMLGGMLAAGPSLGPLLSPLLGAAAGVHVAMLAGMAAGSALALAVGGVVSRRAGARPRLGDAVRETARMG